jgi:hypothetical protein
MTDDDLVRMVKTLLGIIAIVGVVLLVRAKGDSSITDPVETIKEGNVTLLPNRYENSLIEFGRDLKLSK